MLNKSSKIYKKLKKVLDIMRIMVYNIIKKLSKTSNKKHTEEHKP